MNRRTVWKFVALMAILPVAAGIGWSAVTSKPVTLTALPGASFYIPLDIDAGNLIAGVNGQLNFDPAYFSDPVVQLGAGSPGFIVAGNLIEPGQFRFVLYSNPVGAVNLNLPAAYIYMQVSPTLPPGITSAMNYTLEAAGDPNAISLADVSFADVTVNSLRNAVWDWALYE